MKPVSESVPRLTSEGLGLILGERAYGEDVVGADYLGRLREMKTPPSLEALSAVLRSRSDLLKLAGGSREAIFDAYGKDLKLLAKYRDGFKATIDAAILARSTRKEKEAQAFLERMGREISSLIHEPTMNIGPDTLALESPDLLARLQAEFLADVESLKQGLAVWLHVLAESEYVSVIEWLGPDALRYHYFRMDTSKEVLAREVKTEGDMSTGRTRTTSTKVRTEVFNERRSHTVVSARRRSLAEYRGKVPERVAEFINAIPPEIRQFVTIIDGNVTQEEVSRRLILGKVETEVKSVFIPDPAVALFDSYAVTGWGGSTNEAAAWTYAGHPTRRANVILLWSLLATAIAAALILPVGGIRGAGMALVLGVVLTALSQLGMRLENRNR